MQLAASTRDAGMCAMSLRNVMCVRSTEYIPLILRTRACHAADHVLYMEDRRSALPSMYAVLGPVCHATALISAAHGHRHWPSQPRSTYMYVSTYRAPISVHCLAGRWADRQAHVWDGTDLYIRHMYSYRVRAVLSVDGGRERDEGDRYSTPGGARQLALADGNWRWAAK